MLESASGDEGYEAMLNVQFTYKLCCRKCIIGNNHCNMILGLEKEKKPPVALILICFRLVTLIKT